MNRDTTPPVEFLIDLLRPYATERNLTVESARLIRWIINSFGRSVGHRPTLADLNDDAIAGWIENMRLEGLAVETIRGHRNGVLSLWRFAAETGRCENRPLAAQAPIAIEAPAATTAGITLLEYFKTVYRQSHQIRDNSAYQYEVAIRSLDHWAGEPVRMSDFSADLLNAWLAHISKGNAAPATIRNRRRHMLTLWADGYATGECKVEPTKIRSVAMPFVPPRAWKFEEVQFLLRAAERLTGNYPDERYIVSRGSGRRNRHISKKAFWGMIIRLAWDTGLRFGDLLQLKTGQIDSHGGMEVVQSKTGRWHSTRVHAETLHTIASSYPPQREFIIVWQYTETHFQHEFAKLVASAGIGRGSFKKLRKSSATEVEKFHPGCGAAHLGHAAAGGIARAHYLDPRLLTADKPMPRPLRELPKCDDAAEDGEA